MTHLSFGATRRRFLFSFVLISTITLPGWAQKPQPVAPISPAAPVNTAAPVDTAAPGPYTSHESARSADLVTLTATVLNGKREPVTGLAQEAFELSEDGRLIDIEAFDSKDQPASVVIVYDNSGSTANWRALEVARSFQIFLQYSNPENEYSLIMIGEGPQFRFSKAAGPSIAAEAFNRLAQEPAVGSSPIYDACLMGLDALKQGTYEKRVMIVISDGEDSTSQLKFKDLEPLLKRSDVMVYSAAIVNPGFRSSGYGHNSGEEVLQKMAQFTGGSSFTPKDKQALKTAWGSIAWELRHQYRISFRPMTTPVKDRWSNVSVKLAAPRIGEKREPMSIRTKGGYYQPQIADADQLGPNSPPIR